MAEKSNEDHLSWLLVGGFMFVGIGFGMLFGEKQIGTMIGLGLGLIVKVLYPKYFNK